MSYFNKIKLTDNYNNQIEGTLINQLKVANSYRLSGGIFNDSYLDTSYYTARTANGGSVSVSDTEVVISVNTTSDSLAGVYANSLGRYMGANMNYCRSILRVGDTGATNNVRRFGVCDVIPAESSTSFTNGFFFQLSGTTFQIVTRKDDTDIAVSNGSFNGDGSLTNFSYSVDGNYHTLEIFYTNKKVQFVIDNVAIHTVTATTSSLSSTRHFHPFLDSTNTGVGSALTSYAMSLSVNRYGAPTSQAKTYFQQGTTAGVLLKRGPGSLHLMNLTGVQDTSVVTIYDGTSTSGTVLWASGTMGKTVLPFEVDFGDSSGGTPFNDGLFFTITGANSNTFIKYE